ncbi:uncharacterized protein LOC127614482 [Hippocampus zosterae]|uniref:uncharacterized protein LOC127614482 n=1 Tax=Hippocampus zosterae TaxID=109293 RepID=UPI00223DAB26|nr:uncharacterized protein LOC127614482 [Hippocampus zosterae]
MYSNSFFPVILKPSRITVDTATLIDNIFINKIDHKMESGLLINDISDHLPVFAVVHNYFDRKAKSTTRITEIRLRTQRSIDAFKQDLEKQNWTEVYSNEDPNTAFEVFQSTIISLYDKHFPLTKVSKKYKDPSKPWITKGIENACKKKNNLYKLFLKFRTEEAEKKYKTYKNKLVNIIRTSKRDHYHALLEQNKGNTQEIWKILNQVIRNSPKKIDYPEYFIKGKNTILEKTAEIATEFNEYFVNIGSNLAKQIPDPTNLFEIDRYVEKNSSTMFLTAVKQEEVSNIIKTFKNKKSTDCFNIDMTIIKQIIEYVVRPFTHICNLSFKAGIFPSKMKIAKVIPIYKSGEKHLFTNYRPISLLPQFSKY